jgi:hypothetical protein
MVKRYEIQNYITNNVQKTFYVDGIKQSNYVWSTFDARNGDFFYSQSYNEAVNIFVSLWSSLTEQEKNNC